MRHLHHTLFGRWNTRIVADVARLMPNPVAILLPGRRAPHVRVVRWSRDDPLAQIAATV